MTFNSIFSKIVFHIYEQLKESACQTNSDLFNEYLQSIDMNRPILEIL